MKMMKMIKMIKDLGYIKIVDGNCSTCDFYKACDLLGELNLMIALGLEKSCEESIGIDNVFRRTKNV